MKPLDLERFEGSELLNLKLTRTPEQVIAIIDLKPDGSHITVGYVYQGEWLSNILVAGPSLINEIKSLRKWRATMLQALQQFPLKSNDDVMNDLESYAISELALIQAWNAAETELHDGSS